MKFFLLLALVSCASVNRPTEVKVAVESMKFIDEPSPLTKVFVSTGMNEVENDNLLFKDLSKLVYISLAGLGYVPVKDRAEAELLVFLSYGTVDEAHSSTVQVPIYGGLNQTTTVHNVYGQQVGSLKTNNYAPTGYKAVTSNYSIYSKNITLHAFDKSQMEKDNNTRGMLWATSIKSHSTNNNLLQIFPHMLYVGSQYFNKAVDGNLIESIGLNDPQVLKLRAPAAE